MDGYDKHAFEPFAVTVDLAVFTIREAALHVLLVERGQEPYAAAGRFPEASCGPTSPRSAPPGVNWARRPA